jgi:hypothetical protein
MRMNTSLSIKRSKVIIKDIDRDKRQTEGEKLMEPLTSLSPGSPFSITRYVNLLIVTHTSAGNFSRVSKTCWRLFYHHRENKQRK